MTDVSQESACEEVHELALRSGTVQATPMKELHGSRAPARLALRRNLSVD